MAVLPKIHVGSIRRTMQQEPSLALMDIKTVPAKLQA
jgi:hypothetical protein